jgi:hypothetical protein
MLRFLTSLFQFQKYIYIAEYYLRIIDIRSFTCAVSSAEVKGYIFELNAEIDQLIMHHVTALITVEAYTVEDRLSGSPDYFLLLHDAFFPFFLFLIIVLF